MSMRTNLRERPKTALKIAGTILREVPETVLIILRERPETARETKERLKKQQNVL